MIYTGLLLDTEKTILVVPPRELGYDVRSSGPLNQVTATKPGECAVLCPACPQVGLNLESGWENEPPERRYLKI